MTPMRTAPWLLLTIALLCGCTTTATRADLQSAAQARDGNTFPDATYYCGSKNGFDYFLIQHKLGGSESYRVPETDMAVKSRFPFSKDPARWQVYHDVTKPQPGLY